RGEMVFYGPLLPVGVEIGMGKPVQKIRRQFREGGAAAEVEQWIARQGQDVRPLHRVRSARHSAIQSVLGQARGPRFIEPLLERPALIRPPVVVVGRGDKRENTR